MKKKNLFLGLISIFFLIYIICDFFNLTSIVGIKISNINPDLFGLVVNSLVVIVLYVITYFEIDERQVKKEENAQKVGYSLILRAYEKCLTSINVLNDSNEIKKYIIPKIASDKTVLENSILLNIKTFPFDTFERILNLSENGYIDIEKFNSYLWIKDSFCVYVEERITFFDLDFLTLNNEQKQLQNTILILKKQLLDKIQSEKAIIEKILSSIKETHPKT